MNRSSGGLYTWHMEFYKKINSPGFKDSVNKSDYFNELEIWDYDLIELLSSFRFLSASLKWYKDSSDLNEDEQKFFDDLESFEKDLSSKKTKYWVYDTFYSDKIKFILDVPNTILTEIQNPVKSKK